ncbi:PD-(D/E)XK nuclease family protein [Rubritalea spongiae]|uniref:PD-(D/E)XK nuclease family protein n=1 Tax=Rubritalea spongiae TaxID=430797 RepID=A0ABW5E222_9BACT
MPSQKNFLPSNSPLLPAVAHFLLGLGEELKDTLVIVPTAQSGRQLRQQLPLIAGRPVLAPAVTTADVLYAPQADSNAANKMQWWNAWSETLRSYTDSQLEDLFPQLEGIKRDFNWGLNAAQRFCKLKDEITVVDHSFSSVAAIADVDKERWERLASIDKDVKAFLAKHGLRCPAEAKRYAAENWQAPDKVKRLVLACTPDLPALAIKALQNSNIPIEVLVHANEDLAEHFDQWGQPDTAYWNSCPIPLPSPQQECIKLHSSGHDSSEALIKDLSKYASDQVTLAVTDQAFSTLVSDSIEQAGWPCFDPDGRLVSKSGLWAFLKQLRQCLAHSNSFQHVQSLLKAPEARYLLKSIQSPASIARRIDTLFQRSLPQNFDHAIHCADETLAPVLEELQAWLSTRSDDASRFLEKLFDRIERSPDFPTELIDPFLEGIETIKQLEFHKQRLNYHHALELIMASCEGVKIHAERAGTVIDQLGWLEIPYAEQAHLHIVGFHETCVPERPHNDGFLPESLRKKLNLYSREQLTARDSYLLHSIIEARKDLGSTHFYLSQTAPNGEERQASRLLIRCDEEQLPARVQHCFREDIENKKRLPAYSEGGWKLTLQHGLKWPEEKNLSISPSKLTNFLRCPFRFYLQYVEDFQRSDFDSQEMDAMQFGNLVHDVLELYGKDPQTRDLINTEEIEQAFTDLLNTLFIQRYGHTSNLPLIIQKESALNRLKAFAPEQALMREEGWQIKHVELAIGTKEKEILWNFDETPIKMRIDRIDVNQHNGSWRVIDYKTSTKVKKPQEEHLENVRATDDPHHIYGELLPPASSRARAEQRWKNLQLPLYAEFVRQHFQLEYLPEIAYVAFPAAASGTGLQAWSTYDENVHDCAMQWVSQCITAIRQSKFPIRELPSNMRSWDNFADLSPTDLASAFDLTPAS